MHYDGTVNSGLNTPDVTFKTVTEKQNYIKIYVNTPRRTPMGKTKKTDS